MKEEINNLKPLILFRKDNDNKEEYFSCKNIMEIVKYRSLIEENSLVIGRYSVLPFFKELESEVNIRKSKLIDSYNNFQYIADIENYYKDLENYTPKTYFTWYNLPENKYVLKGKTNSRKFQWKHQMFADSAKDVVKVANRLMDDTFIREQGICVREYVPLKTYDYGINDLPITNEWRLFYLGNKLISYGYYWADFEEHKPYEFLPESALNFAQKIANIVCKNKNFFVIDLAETSNGNWIVIELNSGEMAGLSLIDPDKFYTKFNEEIVNFNLSL